MDAAQTAPPSTRGAASIRAPVALRQCTTHRVRPAPPAASARPERTTPCSESLCRSAPHLSRCPVHRATSSLPPPLPLGHTGCVTPPPQAAHRNADATHTATPRHYRSRDAGCYCNQPLLQLPETPATSKAQSALS